MSQADTASHFGFSAGRWNRRAVLQAGCLSTGGLGLSHLLNSDAVAATASGTKAKACIFLFMWGGPSQLETFDPKPKAPAEVRGDFKPIDTNVPGIQISEHFRQTAKIMDKLAVIRSLHHTDPAHLSSGHVALTGHLAPVVRSDKDPPSDKDTPHIGSVMSKLRPSSSVLPSFVTMPWYAFHSAAPGGKAPGQKGGWLGQQYDPFLVKGDPSKPKWEVPSLQLSDGISLNRLNNRRSLLQLIDGQRAGLDANTAVQGMNSRQQQAFSLLSSDKTRQAFDLTQEPDVVRDRYGRNIHGQCVLLARRLVEHGVRLVCVNWHNDGKNYWDTHGNNFNRLKNDLIPPSDQALATLLMDLEERGMLDETLIAWVGEFGRKPQITKNNAGREHWPQLYCGLLAGGGIKGGTVHGASDKHAAYPAEKPVSPEDYVATLYHGLGVTPDTTLPDRTGRPRFLYEGQPLTELF